MKKTVLLLCVVASMALSRAQAQVCVLDSSILDADEFTYVLPALWTPDSPYINTKPACLTEYYEMSVTFNIPDTIVNLPGLPPGTQIPIDNISIATSGAITNIPAGLTYLCNPPNCVFPKNTLGCLLIYGTPTGPVDTIDLNIKVKVKTPLVIIPIELNFPSQINADYHFYLMVRDAGDCSSGTDDLSGQISSVKNVPNPFGDRTLINVESSVSGDFQFEVFDLTGQRVHSQSVQVLAGSNQFTFEAGDLPNGAYFFTFGNAEGRVTRKMVIAR
jgi:hypothetical protein